VINRLGKAGAERSLAAMVPHFVSAGVDVHIAFLVDERSVPAPFERAGASVVSLAGRAGRLGQIHRLRQQIGTWRPDVIHTTLFDADLVGRCAGVTTGVPVVTSLVNVAYGPEQLANPDLRRWRLRSAQVADAVSARSVRRFHAITAHVAAVMARRLRLRDDRIDVVPRGREPAELGSRTPERRARARERLGVAPDEQLVVAAARHEYQKGLDVLLEAFRGVVGRVPAARLLIAGRQGSQTARLTATIEPELADVISILGARDDVHEILCAADVFAFPSRWEGFGSVLLEAMALEAPIVASDLGAVREVVHDEAEALLVPPGDVSRLAAAIERTLEDRQGTEARARAARQRFSQHFTVERVVAEMLAFYERALTRSV